MFEVTVTGQVANIRGGGGTSNVLLSDGSILTFGSRPQYLESLPSELEADVGKTLKVREVPKAEWKALEKRGVKPLRVVPAAKNPEPTSEARVAELTAIKGIGKATAEKLLAHGLQRDNLATATEAQLAAAGLGDAQVADVKTWQTEAIKQTEQLKAERIQESGS